MKFEKCQEEINGVISYAQEELDKLRTNRANPDFLKDVKVEAYNTMNPIKNVANVTVSDPKSLVVQPWDSNIVESVEKGLRAANLGVSIQIEGDMVRVVFPDLTQERREELVDYMNDKIEEARVKVRNVRNKYMKKIDSEEEEGLSEDMAYRYRDEIEEEVKKVNEKLEEIRDKKEKKLREV